MDFYRSRSRSKRSTIKSSNYVESLQEFYDKEILCDMTVQVSPETDEVIKCHKVVLVACSKYFRNLFASKKLKSDVIFTELKFEAVKAIINFMYHDRIDIQKENVLNLYDAAETMQVEEALQNVQEFIQKNMCGQYMSFIMKRVKPRSCLWIRSLCKDKLKRRDKIDTFICKNFFTLVNSEEFLNDITVDLFGYFLQSSKLQESDERNVYEAAVKYLKHLRLHRTFEVIKHVKLALLDLDYLLTIVMVEDILDADESSRKLLKECIYFKKCGTVNKGSVFIRVYHTIPRGSTKKIADNEEHLVCFGSKFGREVNEMLSSVSPDSGRTWFPARGQTAGFIDRNVTATACGDSVICIFYEEHHSKTECYKWITSCNQWSKLKNSPDLRLMSSLTCFDKMLYLCGGIHIKNIYDKATASNYYRSSHVRHSELTAKIYDATNYQSIIALNQLCNGTVQTYDLSVEESWAAAPPMLKERFGHVSCATNGYVFVIGGCDTKSCEMYDVDSKKWSEIKSMNHCRYVASCALLNDAIYVAGGIDSNKGYLSTVEIYDLNSKDWTEVEIGLNTARGYAGMVSKENKLFVVGGIKNGGEDADEVEMFDPATKTWTITGKIGRTHVCPALFTSRNISENVEKPHEPSDAIDVYFRDDSDYDDEPVHYNLLLSALLGR